MSEIIVESNPDLASLDVADFSIALDLQPDISISGSEGDIEIDGADALTIEQDASDVQVDGSSLIDIVPVPPSGPVRWEDIVDPPPGIGLPITMDDLDDVLQDRLFGDEGIEALAQAARAHADDAYDRVEVVRTETLAAADAAQGRADDAYDRVEAVRTETLAAADAAQGRADEAYGRAEAVRTETLAAADAAQGRADEAFDRANVVSEEVTAARGGAATLSARILGLEEVVSDNGSATATQINALEAELSDSRGGQSNLAARLTQMNTARADGDSANATSISDLSAVVNHATTGLPKAHARITAEESARATADTANATSISNLSAQVNHATTGLPNAHSRITTEESTRSSADSALATRATNLESEVSGARGGQANLSARITQVDSARSSGDAALATRATNLETAVNHATTGLAPTRARLLTEETARADGDSANATSISDLSAVVVANRTRANLMGNTSLTQGLATWHLTLSGLTATTLRLRLPSETYSGAAYPTLAIFQNNGTSTGYADVRYARAMPTPATTDFGVPVSPGQWIEASFGWSTHRCTAELRIEWRDAAGAVLSYSEVASIPTASNSSTDPNSWPRARSIGQAPASAARAVIHFRKNATIAGQTTSYLFINKPYLGVMASATAEAQEWVEGSGEEIITARITAEESARATADTANATSISNLSAQVNHATTGLPSAHSRITTEESTRSSADSALATRATNLESEVSGARGGQANLSARITQVDSARSSGDAALATRATNLETAVNHATTGLAPTRARLLTEETARADGDSANATALSVLEAKVDNQPGAGFDAALVWNFDTSVDGFFAGNGAAVSASDGSLTITSTNTSPYLYTPTFSITGAVNRIVQARVKRTAGAGWRGNLYYTRTNAPTHGDATAYRKTIPNPGLAIGQAKILEWDMADLTAGGTDWVTATISRLRLDLGSTAADVFEIDWVAIGRYGPPSVAAQVASEAEARANADTANASAITAVDAKANSATASGAVALVAEAAPSGYSASYSWRLVAGNVKTGLTALAKSDGTSAVAIDASAFFIRDPNVGSGDPKPIFAAVGGKFVMQGDFSLSGNLIVGGSILYGSLAPSAVQQVAHVRNRVRFQTVGSTSWTVPANVFYIRVKLWGGGGGGGYTPTGFGASSGGGSGAYVEHVFAVTPGQSVTVLVGGGGTGAWSSGFAQTGGTTSVTVGAVSASAYGGSGGGKPNDSTTSNPGQGGGFGSGLDFGIYGAAGGLGTWQGNQPFGGNGGGAPNGGPSVPGGQGMPSGGAAPGGGGAGSVQPAYGGGNGSRGEVWIEW